MNLQSYTTTVLNELIDILAGQNILRPLLYIYSAVKAPVLQDLRRWTRNSDVRYKEFQLELKTYLFA